MDQFRINRLHTLTNNICTSFFQELKKILKQKTSSIKLNYECLMCLSVFIHNALMLMQGID